MNDRDTKPQDLIVSATMAEVGHARDRLELARTTALTAARHLTRGHYMGGLARAAQALADALDAEEVAAKELSVMWESYIAPLRQKPPLRPDRA